jgi:hypothetical protein
MKNKILISMLLLASIMAIETSKSALAAPTASQTLTATLALLKKVETNGGTTNSTIDPDTGDLVTAFTPGFRIQTNTNAAQTLDLSATCTGGTTKQSFFEQGGTQYITLANTTVIPTDTEIDDAQAATPVDTQNPNVIAYPVTPPSNIPSDLVWGVFGSNKWVATLTNKGKTDTSLTVPAGAARPNTYSGDDEVGSYVAIVTLAFNP